MEVQHTNPAWIEKADSVIGANINDPVWSKIYNQEQLAARNITSNTYELCSIPFMVYDLCLGDVVEVDNEYTITSIAKRSYHVGFRVATKGKDQQEAFLKKFKDSLKFNYELFSDKLMSLDSENVADGEKLALALEDCELKGSIIQYETIRTAVSR